jgi:hypothetical protein
MTMLDSFLRSLTSGDEWSAKVVWRARKGWLPGEREKAERLLRTAQTVAGEVLG